MRLIYIGKDTSFKVGDRNVEIKNGATFGIRVHTKEPSYFAAAAKSREVAIDGRVLKMVLHPKKTGDRVNFVSTKKDTWLFVDDQQLWDFVNSGKSRLEFETAEGRAKAPAVEAEKPADAKPGATKPATERASQTAPNA